MQLPRLTPAAFSGYRWQPVATSERRERTAAAATAEMEDDSAARQWTADAGTRSSGLSSLFVCSRLRPLSGLDASLPSCTVSPARALPGREAAAHHLLDGRRAALLLLLAALLMLLVLYQLRSAAWERLCRPQHPWKEKEVHPAMQELLFRAFASSAAASWYEAGVSNAAPCAASSPPSSVAVLMVDSRSYFSPLQSFLIPGLPSSDDRELAATFSPPDSPEGPSYAVSLSLALNLLSLAPQGQPLLYYELQPQRDPARLAMGAQAAEADDSQTEGKQSPRCFHAVEGWRSAPWCKLQAIAHALSLTASSPPQPGAAFVSSRPAARHGRACSASASFESGECPLYDSVLYLDTDAALVSDLPLQRLLADWIRGGLGDETGQADVFFADDGPFQSGVPNSGLLWLHNTRRARGFLRLWWDAHLPRFNQRNTYEQHPLWQRENGGLDLFRQHRQQFGLALMRRLAPVQTALWDDCVPKDDPRRYAVMGVDWGDECALGARTGQPVLHFAHVFREHLSHGLSAELLVRWRRRMAAVARAVQGSSANSSGNSTDSCETREKLLLDRRLFHHIRLDGFSFQMSALAE